LVSNKLAYAADGTELFRIVCNKGKFGGRNEVRMG
jgi:hypothetical protein